jgi:hypothetical protein
MASRLPARRPGKPHCTGFAHSSSAFAWAGQNLCIAAAETALQVMRRSTPMLQQTLWFALFLALMFLLPPLVAMDLAIP